MKYVPPTREEVFSIGKAYKDSLLKNLIPVVDVRIFGSYAHGNPHKWSDIDIAVIHKKFDPGSRLNERSVIQRLQVDDRYPVDILCFYPEELDNKLIGIAREVKENSISV